MEIQQKPNKKMVTLYLDAQIYEQAQEKNENMSKYVNELIAKDLEITGNIMPESWEEYAEQQKKEMDRIRKDKEKLTNLEEFENKRKEIIDKTQDRYNDLVLEGKKDEAIELRKKGLGLIKELKKEYEV